MSLAHPRREICAVVYRPSRGHEDPKTVEHSKDLWFYVVGYGHNRAIYTDEWAARQQVSGFSGGQWKKEKTWAAAVQRWDLFCERYHNHSQDVIAPPSSPSPSPSPRGSPVDLATPSPSPPTSPSRLSASVSTASSLTASSMPPRHPAARHRTPTLPSAAPTTPTRPAASSSRGRASASPSTLRPSPTTATTTPRQVTSRRLRWREGDVLTGILGVPLLFEDRYDAVDYLFDHKIRTADLWESRNRRRMEAFVADEDYVPRPGDADDSD
ncbi:hypothetical protein C8R47DRAFT_1205116 [Mycena vitilis]|nr:hypothetical protein C8R47DRAFT_1205116 [Mycena vitilis]